MLSDESMTIFHRPLKRFGQNFLTDPNIVRKIIESVDIGPSDNILEIGPGAGALTYVLAKKAKSVTAVEIDKKLCADLQILSKDISNIDILCCDILKFKLKQYALSKKIKSFKVVANLPFYITTPIIEYLFKNINLVSDIFIMVQKEVAGRMKAKTGTKIYGSFTCFVNYYCEPEVLFNIKAGSFWPVPKVESCFMRLKPYVGKSKGAVAKSESLLFKIIRAAFGQRRKRLVSSLSNVVDKRVLLSRISNDILIKRPEDISLAEFANISNSIRF